MFNLYKGHLTHSNSLVADSFHMLSDMISFIVAVFAIFYSKKKFDAKSTFGLGRSEILGGLINSTFLLALCFSIIIEAIQRFFEPHHLENVNLIITVGTIGFGINFFGLIMFSFLGKI